MPRTTSRRERSERLRRLARALRERTPYPHLVEICKAEREADNLDRDSREYVARNWKKERMNN